MQKTLSPLPEVYSNVRPVNVFNKEREISDYAQVNIEPTTSIADELEKENRYTLTVFMLIEPNNFQCLHCYIHQS